MQFALWKKKKTEKKNEKISGISFIKHKNASIIRLNNAYLWKLVVDITCKMKPFSPQILSWTAYHTTNFVDFIRFTEHKKK